jgi:hypothetical protein
MSLQSSRFSARPRGGVRESPRLAAAMTNLFLGCLGAYLLLVLFLPTLAPTLIGGAVLVGAGLSLGLAVWLDTGRGRRLGRSLLELLGRGVGLVLGLSALVWILQNWVLVWLEHFPYNIAGGT